MLAFLRSSAALFVGKSALFGVRIVALLAMANVGAKEVFTCISFAVALSELGRLVADYGTETWSLRAIAGSHSTMEKAKVVSTALFVKAMFGAVACVVIVVTCAAKFGHIGLIAGVLAGVLVFTTQIAGLAIVSLQAEDQLQELKVLAAPCVLTAIAVFGCLAVTGNSLFALAALCTGETVASVVLLAVLRRRAMLTGPLPSATDIRKMLAACAPIALLNVLAGLYMRMDTLVVAELSLSSLAAYTVANRLFQPFQVGAMTLGSTVYSRAAAALSKDRASLRPFVRRLLPLIGLTALAAGVLLWGVGSEIVETFLPGYRSALVPVRLFAVMSVVTALSSTAVGILWACGEFAVVTRIMVIETAGALVALLILVPAQGATGAAEALLVASLVTVSIQWPYAIIAWRRQLALPVG